MTDGTSVYKKGLPYGPDLRRLDDAFPTPQEGEILRYEQIEEVIHHGRTEGRFKAVLHSWRRLLFRTRNIDTKALSGIGIEILEPADRAKHREKGIMQKSRQVRLERQRYASTPRERLNAEGQQRYDHVLLLSGRIQMAIDDARKQMSVDIAPVRSLPKARLIKNA